MYSSGRLTHSRCVNFKDGICTLYGVPVPADGEACPNFTPKPQPQATTLENLPQPPMPRPPSFSPPQMPMSLRYGLRRRFRHRIRRGRGR